MTDQPLKVVCSNRISMKQMKEAANEYHEIRVRLARLESLLVQADEDFHRQTIDHHSEQMRGFGGQGSALASRLVLKGR